MRLFYRKRYFLLIVLIGLTVTACGAPTVTPEPVQALVEVSDTPDQSPVEVLETPTETPDAASLNDDEPADADETPSPDPEGDYVVYPGAEFLNSNNWGAQIRVYRYTTVDPMDEVMAFYQAQYPHLNFHMSEGTAAGLVVEGDEAHIETGVFNIWIYHTDQAYFDRMAFMPSSYIPGKVLEAMPNNRTLIELHTTN